MADTYKKFMELELFNEEEELTDDSVQLAASILMFEVGRADGDLDSVEVAEMVDILKNQFGLNSEEVTRLIHSARETSHDDVNLEKYTSLLCEHWGQKERARLLNDFWVLALTDMEIDHHERDLIQRIAELLKLDKDEIDRARIHAEHVLELSTS
ncbi:MAG: TerB family tellurite resistance protein [Gammaproteobacteria bacterium]|nr:TerB family tellurite resistance protein [Gammaproteobacteria bacterium]